MGTPRRLAAAGQLVHRQGGDGDDELLGSPLGDLLTGQKGKDRLLGRKGPDMLRGGAGKDVLKGGGGNDTLRGQRPRPHQLLLARLLLLCRPNL